MEEKLKELEKRVLRLEVRVDDIEKVLYIIVPSLIAAGIRAMGSNPDSINVGFSTIYFALAGLALYKLTVSGHKRKEK